MLDLADWRRQVAQLYATWRAESVAAPETATAAFRAARDRLFAEHTQTPLPATERGRFEALPYFNYDPAFQFGARLEPLPADVDEVLAVELPNSGSDQPAFRRIGRLPLGGPLAGSVLTVFWIEGYAGGLFVPFRDATSARQTYGAGRYLLDTIKGADLGANSQTGELMLDFNMAFHPSCAYDPRWSCPLAPAENWLAAPVTAGERLR